VPEIYRNRTLSGALEEHLAQVPNLTAARCNPFTGKVLIIYDQNELTLKQVLDDIHIFQKGQHAARLPLRREKVNEPEDLPIGLQTYRLAGLGLIILGLLVRRLFKRGPSVNPPWLLNLNAATIIVSSYPFLRSGLQKVSFLKHPGSDFWVGVTGCALLIMRSDFLSLLVLFSGYLSAFVQARTLHRSEMELEKIFAQLDAMAPETLPIENETEFCFQKGQQIYQSGTIINGTAILDESSLTGSPLPILKYQGEKALRGSWVLAGKIQIEPYGCVDERSDLSLPLASVVPSEIFGVENYTRQISRVAIAAALGVLLLTRNIERSLAVLLASSPAAASVSAAAAYRFGLAKLSQEGVLIKDIRSLQILKESDTILFDKTGTLTGSRSYVSDVLPVNADYTAEDIVRLSAACEEQVSHPAGQSVLAHAREKDLSIPPAKWRQIFVGQGVKGEVEGKQLRIGNRQFMENEGISLEPAVHKSRRLNHLGQSVVFVAVDNQVAGVIGLHDDVRPYCQQLIKNLRLLGIPNMGILTGDTDEAAQNLGQVLGIGQIWSEKMPEEKARVVTNLQEQGKIVTMVGDGLNDVSAMHTADIGICMSQSKEKICLEAADIVLAGTDLTGLIESIHIAHLCGIIAQQNLLIASGANYSSLALAMGGVLNPLASIIIANLGTLAIILNSSRILH
jgi:ATPase, P-type (transporting), HAD superfamily, subfamily IC